MQNTLKASVAFEGVGLHGGAPARVVLHPAPAGYGIRFHRTDIKVGNAEVIARWDQVERVPLCTRLVNAAGVSVSTVEHLMAALAGCGIHNARIEIDGPEVPILDGSAAPFVRGIMRHGLRPLPARVEVIEVLHPVSVSHGDARASLLPYPGVRIDFEIDFEDAAIGRQRRGLDLRNGAFARELCDSRTFCRQADVDAMQAQGLALGGTLENAVVVDGAEVLSPGGFRHPDEAVRHKMLDALGDLALAGAPILGRYVGEKAGHALTNLLLHELFSRKDAWRRVTCAPRTAATLPGVGLVAEEIPEVA